MASVIKEPNGRRRIEYILPDLPRQRIRLGKVSQRTAESIKSKIEHLITASVSGCGWDNDLAEWVARIGDDLADKLAEARLIPPRDRIICPGLKAFVESLRDSRPNLKPNTRRNYDQTIRRMTGYFGDDRKLDSISCGDADQWRDQMLKDGLAPATVGREIKRARQFFRVAVRRKLIEENPFTEVNAPAQVNTSREHFITREVTEKVLAACPDAEWRLIVALSRYGGLRCPSEHLALRWGDIDWENDRINLPTQNRALAWGSLSNDSDLYRTSLLPPRSVRASRTRYDLRHQSLPQRQPKSADSIPAYSPQGGGAALGTAVS